MVPTNSSSDNSISQLEYQGLREEIVSRTNAAIQILTFTLIAFDTILTIAYSGNSGGIGNLILFYNVIAVFPLLIYLSNKVAIYAIGKFIRITYPDEKWEKTAGKGLWQYKVLHIVAAIFFYIGTELLTYFAASYASKQAPTSIMNIAAGISIIITIIALLLVDVWRFVDDLLQQCAQRLIDQADADSAGR